MTSGGGQYRPPGKAKILFMWLGDQVIGLLMAFGWTPKEERENKPPR